MQKDLSPVWVLTHLCRVYLYDFFIPSSSSWGTEPYLALHIMSPFLPFCTLCLDQFSALLPITSPLSWKIIVESCMLSLWYWRETGPAITVKVVLLHQHFIRGPGRHCSYVTNGPSFLLLLLYHRYLSIMWYLPSHVSHYDSSFAFSHESLWLITMSHYDSYLWSPSDSIVPVTSIVLWPIVQGDSIVPVTPIILVTLLFSFTISTSSLWPYSLRLDFCILWYRQAIRALFPTLIPLSIPVSRLFALRPLIA